MSEMAFELDLKKNAGFVLDLSKASPSLEELKFQVTWKEHPIHGASLTEGYDLDISTFFLCDNGKVKAPQDVLFFNNQTVYNGAGNLPEDERAGGTEYAIFTLSKVPADRVQLDHYVNVFEAFTRKQSFLMMTDAKVELINNVSGQVLASFLLNDYTNDNALHVGSTIRKGNGWEFKLVGASASVESLNDILKNYF